MTQVQIWSIIYLRIKNSVIIQVITNIYRELPDNECRIYWGTTQKLQSKIIAIIMHIYLVK